MQRGRRRWLRMRRERKVNKEKEKDIRKFRKFLSGNMNTQNAL